MKIYRRKHRKRPKFKKNYKFTKQDEYKINQIGYLQRIYGEIAKELYGNFEFNLGDWTLKACGLSLFIDPEFGSQVEIEGTSNMPVFKRLIIHIGLLKLIKERKGIFKTVKLCHSMLMKQSESLMSLRSLP